MADKPTGNPDSSTSDAIMGLLKELNRDVQTIVMVTHEPSSDLAVKIFINSIDRPRVIADSRVNIMLDALPDLQLEGRLESISDSGERRSEWGGDLYYQGVVLFESAQVRAVSLEYFELASLKLAHGWHFDDRDNKYYAQAAALDPIRALYSE